MIWPCASYRRARSLALNCPMETAKTPVRPLAGLKVARARSADRRSVRRQGPRRVRRRSHQDRAAASAGPGGDPLRQWRLLHDGTSLWWYVQARNKKSRDRQPAHGRRAGRSCAALARDADVVIENFRPGTLEKWGLGYDALAADNPGLILLRLSGFGQTGPVPRPARASARSANRWAACATSRDFRTRPPVRMNISIGDALAALHGVIGVLMALHHRDAAAAARARWSTSRCTKRCST